MVQTGHAVAVAFALNIAAGAATILGGMVIFSKRLVYLANSLSLAVALSISSGVMMFISLVEIFGESVNLLTEGLHTEDMTEETATGHAWLVATGCFAVGIALIYAIDVAVHKLSPEHEITEIENLGEVRESMDQFESEKKMSSKTSTPALAIGIHNLPEGIATSVGAIQNSSVGFSLAVGIGLHNIPEGIAPIGGLIAWLAIGDGMDPVSEGILFGIVCGIMVCICIKELIPTSYKFAKDKTHVVAVGMFAGMFIMVASLTLFGYAGV
ncbi:Zinc (Zn2)-Iron (Fe2) Permease (ZIP) Family [Phytophthora infestans T30-4]|uniref:Zinc (Zn2 )-Iron (Fe2 ) Permease (ZIP) Family n=1 Tax=Phytophthora infestans (strain T30-4) TaxID=403677 RepID=D0MRQ7_PHYIT|nr:Zinc (Zn2)-Iron (Fe2) Permease (ZIP) Family [Phytophthora infestans T30-4]EEY58176.1 Zinc (Zn2)-Iron (Fe2) Permease (ZIP) Family [Phytophthora infestans T30-4]|eukprot:XP_002909362.1 Zinc (Zn2)-Iron (Fe2) Permease (ZIP) Family [Phytophthora infestans T30-4]